MKILPVGESASTTAEVAGGSQLYHLPSMASKTTTALGQSQPWGRIEVFPSAVAAVAGHAALRCYGIAGMSARGMRDGFAELLRRENVDRGVEVNRLNVFPVPDGDTGTNMLLTLQSAVEDIKDSNAIEVSRIARLASHGSLMGARGNSGVILSQIFRGFARAVEGKATLEPKE